MMIPMSLRRFRWHVLPLSDCYLLTLTRGLRCNKHSLGRNLRLRKAKEGSRVLSIGEIEEHQVSEQFTKEGTEGWIEEQHQTEPITARNQHDQLANLLTPLHMLPYEEQVGIKWWQSKQALEELKYRLNKVNVYTSGKNKLPCELTPMFPSPALEEYRNKDEFWVNVGVDGNPKTVGFIAGNFKDGTARCVGPQHVVNTKQKHKLVARHFQDFIRQSSLRACHLFKDGGHWRGITVRSNVCGDTMATVVMHPQKLTKIELEEQKAHITSYFQSLDDCKITSMYFQACRHKRCMGATCEHLFGEPYIHEELLGTRFRISPMSFYQINTAAAELLYKTVVKLCEIDERSIVIDICSGTGTVGLLMAPHVRAVVGIEANPQAVEDAVENAKLNGIRNASFICGTVELVLPSLVSSLTSDKVVAVVSPTQIGVAKSVIRTLRKCQELKRIVYVSCNPRGPALENFVSLCVPESETMPGMPFSPKIAVPLDMFPHTNHVDLVVAFSRRERLVPEVVDFV